MAVTIKDVAKKAGTSTATVSKVMNGSYSISEETIQRVKQAMEELNYQPNQRARNLANKSSQTIVFVCTLEHGSGFNNPHMFEMICGLEDMLSRREYHLVIKSISKEEARQYILDAYDMRQADGFVIHASVISPALDEVLFKNAIPHVVLGAPAFNNHCCWIDVDNRLAGELAANFLLEKGYQSLAYIGGMAEDQISMRRYEGVLMVLNEHDVILPKGYIQQGESQCDSAYSMMESILSLKSWPDAVICANNYMAYGCVKALQDHKVAIPEQMAVITFDDFPFSKILKPLLTVVDIDMYDMGNQAGKYVLQKIRKSNLYIQSYTTLPCITEREST